MTKDRVLIFDTTLRDGEQSPGATMTHEEKLEIAEFLDEMGVDIIEAGFPIASEGDFRAVSEIAERTKNATICGLARANYKDIDRCWEAVKHAKSPRIHTFIGTSPLHRAIPNLDMDQMAERIHDTVTHARNLCDNVQWSPMDATRTEWDYLCRVVEIAIKAGATTINIPDTVGYTAPAESADLIKRLLETVPGMGDQIYVRCHPISSRHATHLYKKINKAYIHLVFTDDELKQLGYENDIKQRTYFPQVDNNRWFGQAKLKAISHDCVRSDIDPFFKQNEMVKSRIMRPPYNRGFPDHQLGQVFNDYVLVRA